MVPIPPISTAGSWLAAWLPPWRTQLLGLGDPVVGSRVYSAIDQGQILVEGQVTAFFPDGALRDYERAVRNRAAAE